MPLAHSGFGPAECDRFVAANQWLWDEHGYGPWAYYNAARRHASLEGHTPLAFGSGQTVPLPI